MLLILSVGSIYASENSDFTLDDNLDDDFELDEGLDDDSDSNDEELDDEDLEDDDDDWGDDSDDDEEDLDDGLGDDLDEDFDDDVNGSDYLKSYEYLEFKVISYLDRYGNCSDENWTQSQEFLNEYQIYLSNPSNYTLNESAEGYETYLKIFDSITSTFGEYNLTENETEYLKFLIIFYLNHYGNVSANYTWNESDEFSNYDPWFELATCVKGWASGSASGMGYGLSFDLNNPIGNVILNNSTDTNSTSNGDNAEIIVPQDDFDWNNIILLVLVIILVVFVII